MGERQQQQQQQQWEESGEKLKKKDTEWKKDELRSVSLYPPIKWNIYYKVYKYRVHVARDFQVFIFGLMIYTQVIGTRDYFLFNNVGGFVKQEACGLMFKITQYLDGRRKWNSLYRCVVYKEIITIPGWELKSIFYK